MKRVYIAGKLNDVDAVRYLHNVHKMMHVAELVRRAGFAVYVPAIDLLMGIAWGYTSYFDYFSNSQPWLDVADAVFLVPGWLDSPGTAKEIKRAKKGGIPMYESLLDICEDFGCTPGFDVISDLLEEFAKAYGVKEAVKR